MLEVQPPEAAETATKKHSLGGCTTDMPPSSNCQSAGADHFAAGYPVDDAPEREWRSCCCAIVDRLDGFNWNGGLIGCQDAYQHRYEWRL